LVLVDKIILLVHKAFVRTNRIDHLLLRPFFVLTIFSAPLLMEMLQSFTHILAFLYQDRTDMEVERNKALNTFDALNMLFQGGT